jgi:hypothetical protein
MGQHSPRYPDTTFIGAIFGVLPECVLGSVYQPPQYTTCSKNLFHPKALEKFPKFFERLEQELKMLKGLILPCAFLLGGCFLGA